MNALANSHLNDTSNCKRFQVFIRSSGVWNGLRCFSLRRIFYAVRGHGLKLGVRISLVLTLSFL